MTSGRLHDLSVVGLDADGYECRHAPVLCMDLVAYVPRCDECALPAGVLLVDACPLGRRADGTPRYPDEVWMLFYRCRGLTCCLSERCEASHLTRHRIALDRQRAREAA